jgi:hypothetical protein
MSRLNGKRRSRLMEVTALPPVHDRSKELLGVIGSRPVLPCYFEVEPLPKRFELSIEEIVALLFVDLGECA